MSNHSSAASLLGQIARRRRPRSSRSGRSTYGAWVPVVGAGPLPVSRFPRNDITNGRTTRRAASAPSDHRKRGM